MTIQELIQKLREACPSAGNLPREIKLIDAVKQDRGEVRWDAVNLTFTINKF